MLHIIGNFEYSMEYWGNISYNRGVYRRPIIMITPSIQVLPSHLIYMMKWYLDSAALEYTRTITPGNQIEPDQKGINII